MSMLEVYHSEYMAVRRRLWGKPKKQKPLLPEIKLEEEIKKTAAELRHEKKISHAKYLDSLILEAAILYSNGHVNVCKDIIRDVAGKHGFVYSDIMKKSRDHKLVVARHEAVWAVKKAFPEKSYPALGKIFKLDHSSCIHAVRAHVKRNSN